jgi:cephalosporin hydroxylase
MVGAVARPDQRVGSPGARPRGVALKLRKFVRHWVHAPSPPARWITNRFHALYYYRRRQTWQNTTWLGTDVLKCPLDLWVYQELLHELRPDWIIETGTAFGGSAAYLAALCDLLGQGRVVSVDIEARNDRPSHPRIEYLTGSSVDPAMVEAVRRRVAPGDRVVVILDSDHSRDHVLAELRAYHSLVGVGSYCIVEDSNVGGHPVAPELAPGPMEAIRAFLAENDSFAVDPSREKFYLTFNPGGFLKRVK